MNISQPRERQRNQPSQTSADGRQAFGLRINGVNTSAAAPEDNTMMSRAQRFEDEKHRIMSSCFSKRDDTGALLESYITHIRVTEDATYPSSPPPPDSPPENKKPRVIVVAVRKSGRVRMHKARENASGSFSIGKSWVLDDLSSIESFSATHPCTPEEEESRRWAGNVGFIVTINKPYFWQADTLREKDFFIASLVKIYRKYTGGKVPSLIGFEPREIQQMLGVPTRQSDTATSPARASEEPISPLTTNALELGGQQTTSDSVQRPQYSMQTGPSLVPSHMSQGMTTQPSDGHINSLGAGNINSSIHSLITDKSSSQTSLPLRSGTGTTSSSQVMDDGRGRPRPEVGNWASKGIGGSPGRQPRSSPQRPPFTSRSSNDGHFVTSMGRASSTGRGTSSSRTTPNTSQMDVRSTSSREHVLSQSATSSTRPSLEDRPPSSGRERMMHDENKVSLDSARSRHSPRPEKMSIPGGWAATPEISEKPSFISDRSERGITPPPSTLTTSIPSAASTSPQPTVESLTEMKNEEETHIQTHRPGLGPMIKKKSARDVATTFRKAATAYNAFKPRAGGAGDRLREKEEGRRPSIEGEPDGINGVVPAPSSLIRGRGSYDKDMMNDNQSRPSISSSHSIVGDADSNQDTEDTKAKQADLTQSLSAPRSPSKPSQPQEEQLQPHVPNSEAEAELIRLAQALDISPSIFLSDPRSTQIHNTFTSTLREFNFDPTTSAFNSQNLSKLEADVKRELDRVEAGRWLLNLEENDARVEEVENLLDKAIAECDVMDGLLSLYSAELNTLSEDVRYIESQSQGLAIEMANRQALKGELERTLKENHGVPLNSTSSGMSANIGTGLSSAREGTDSVPASAPAPGIGLNHSSLGSSGMGSAERYGQRKEGNFQNQNPSNANANMSMSSFSSSNTISTLVSSRSTAASARDTTRRLMERRERWEGRSGG